MMCDKYNASMLRTAVEFQRSTKTSDGAGGFTETWTELLGAPVRAYVKQLSGREQYQSDRIEATVKMRLATRFSAVIDERDRVVIRGRAYNIASINNLEMQDRWLEIDLAGGVVT